MEVLIPKPGSWYVNSSSLRSSASLCGPFHDDGDPWERVRFSDKELSDFTQGASIAHEKSVTHRKIDGNIYVIPALKGLTPIRYHSSSGFPVYKVDCKWRSGSTWFNRSIETTLQLILTGQESFGYEDKSLYHGYFVTRFGNDTVLDSYVHTFKSGSWGDKWLPISSGLTISRFDKDSLYYRQGALSGGPIQIGGSGQVPGVRSLEGGKVVARNAIVRKKVTTGQEYWTNKLFLPETDFSMSEVRKWISDLLQPSIMDDLPSLSLDSYGDLIMHATDNLDANSANMIAFVKDLRDVKSLVPKLKELGKIKTHASNYLAFEYGVLPTISDLESIWDAFKTSKYYDRSGYRRVAAYDIDVSSVKIKDQLVPIQHTRRIHVAVNDNDTGLDSLIEKARSIGVFPSLTNLWDLVPYSFVIDWFVDVGSVLERIDTRHRLINLDIPYVIKSDKKEAFASFSDPSIGAGMSIVISDYDRQVTLDVPQPRIFGEINKPPTVQNHWIEGSALILQRTK